MRTNDLKYKKITGEETTEVILLNKMPGGGSDLTLKQDIAGLNNALTKVLTLRPVTWHWKEDGHNDRDLQYGFIAQEVEKVLPNLVSEGMWRDGSQRKFITVGDLVPYLVAAMQEQQTQIIALKKLVKKETKEEI
ncbi:MAG: tail fiber domain-containing protein [Candidatus Levyibacteriota bacterium]